MSKEIRREFLNSAREDIKNFSGCISAELSETLKTYVAEIERLNNLIDTLSVNTSTSSSSQVSFTGVIHSIKSIQPHYNDSVDNRKTFEFRQNDRNYQVGDILRISEYDENTKIFSGRTHYKLITHIMKDHTYFSTSFVALSTHLLSLDTFCEMLRNYNLGLILTISGPNLVSNKGDSKSIELDIQKFKSKYLYKSLRSVSEYLIRDYQSLIDKYQGVAKLSELLIYISDASVYTVSYDGEISNSQDKFQERLISKWEEFLPSEDWL